MHLPHLGLLGLALLLGSACTPGDATHTDTDTDPVVPTDTTSEDDTDDPTDTDPVDDTDTDTDSDSDTDTDPAGPGPGLGVLTGSCGELVTVGLASTDAALFRNQVDLGTDGFVLSELNAEAQTVATNPNRGGSSLESEGLSFDVLHRCEGATLTATETQILYTDSGPRTDILVQLDSADVAVSVTRAFGWPWDTPYTSEAATSLISGKLEDMTETDALASPKNPWTRHVLHVLTPTAADGDVIEAAWAALDAEVRHDHLLLLTVTAGNSATVYDQGPPQ